jgi:uncharacterized cupredoxin-like copper-binding protein
MSTITPEPSETRDGADLPSPSDEALLLELRDEVRRQGASIRSTERAFSIFAFLAFLIAMATLLAVVFKLDAKDTSSSGASGSAAAGSAAAAKPAAAPLPSKVGVGLGQFYIRPSAKAAAAGRVTFAVRNQGAITHELVVLKTDKPAGDLLKGARADETGNVGETGDLAPGASKTINLKLAAGHYALICNLPGHYKAGQYLDFTVR